MVHPFVNVVLKWRYLLLLCALLALLVIQPIAAACGFMGPLFDALFVLVMATLVFALAQDKVWRLVACTLCIPAVILSVGGHFLPSTTQLMSVTAGHTIAALFFVAAAGKTIHSIITSQELHLDSIFGAISGYILLGVAWAFVYAMIHTTNPESFQFGHSIRTQMEQGDFSRNIFVYYSFVTLTTVGFGDVTPLSIPARTLSWVEAVTGQLYLAVLIAGLISALVAKNSACSRRQ
ncbi:MAG: two pore domain potassium channel family protein [Pirellulales bacterium]|nr:two pore domain potassium channel family protein [Pirellulales bacterium]